MSGMPLRPCLRIYVLIPEQFCGSWDRKGGTPSARSVVSWITIDSPWIATLPPPPGQSRSVAVDRSRGPPNGNYCFPFSVSLIRWPTSLRGSWGAAFLGKRDLLTGMYFPYLRITFLSHPPTSTRKHTIPSRLVFTIALWGRSGNLFMAQWGLEHGSLKAQSNMVTLQHTHFPWEINSLFQIVELDLPSFQMVENFHVPTDNIVFSPPLFSLAFFVI